MTVATELAARIKAKGPISLADYMATANAHYYGTRDPLGAEGDFITAPEISQMFGELIGLWFADLWMRMGKPDVHYVELGPGRGTLARDALRAMTLVGCRPSIHLVETSLTLRLRQAENLPNPTWHQDFGSVPRDAPLFVVANEFFDALPIHQLVKSAGLWRQRAVDCRKGVFSPVLGNPVPMEIIPEELRGADDESVIETCPVGVRMMQTLSARMAEQGGAGLVIDYGYQGPVTGDTFQAVKAHKFASPWEEPGERDLTAHVDFETLAAVAQMQLLKVYGPVGQGPFLNRLGLVERANALAGLKPEYQDQLFGERDRLAAPDQMGRLFKVMAVSHGDWPEPDGF